MFERTGAAPGVYGKTRRMWMSGFVYKSMFFIRKSKSPLPGNDVDLHISGPFGKSQVRLSDLRTDELVALHSVIECAFANALPICIERDKAAARAFEAGDTEHTRVFRDPPSVWKREGPAYADLQETLRTEWKGGNGEQYIKSYVPFMPESIDLDDDEGYDSIPTED